MKTSRYSSRKSPAHHPSRLGMIGKAADGSDIVFHSQFAHLKTRASATHMRASAESSKVTLATALDGRFSRLAFSEKRAKKTIGPWQRNLS